MDINRLGDDEAVLRGHKTNKMPDSTSLLLFVSVGILCPESALGFGKYLQQKYLAKEEEEEGGTGVQADDEQQVQDDSPVAVTQQTLHSICCWLRNDNFLGHKKFWQAILYKKGSVLTIINCREWGDVS